MYRWLNRALGTGAACALVLLALPVHVAAVAEDDATILRVFLRDGTSLVSYGEPARVADRVIFSIPTGPLPNPPLHLINIPAEKVDWDKTDRYANSARADRYIKGQAEMDYAELSGQLAQTLNDVASAADAGRRLAIVEEARQALAAWPANHFNYREKDVRQMVGMLDEAIADLRASVGVSRFNLTFEAHTTAPPHEPLLPLPSLREAIEQVLSASRLVDNAAERTSLLSAALANIDRNKDALPPEWVSTVRTDIDATLREEARIDLSYRAMSAGMLALADQRAKEADVRGVDRVLTLILMRDRQLGSKRPDSVAALMAAVEAKLDATRRLRLARDRWELRAPVLSRYRAAINAPMTLFAQIKPSLEAIKELSGSSGAALDAMQRVATDILRLTNAIVPPEELAAAHALLASAVQMAENAASIRRDATLANSMDLAWNASSAAAGSLMLGARARSDIQSLLRPPQLR